MGLVGVFLALLGVIWLGEARYQLAGAVGAALVVVVAGGRDC